MYTKRQAEFRYMNNKMKYNEWRKKTATTFRTKIVISHLRIFKLCKDDIRSLLTAKLIKLPLLLLFSFITVILSGLFRHIIST
jgi:hypothetical protein